MEGYFWNGIFSDSEPMIVGSEVYLREITSTLKLVKQVIDFGKRILVLDCDIIVLTIVYTHPKRTIFLAYE